MGGNIPGGNFLGGNFLGIDFPGGNLMGGNFPGGNFPRTNKSTVLKEISGLSTNKASQDSDLPVKSLKENADYFAEFICIQFNDSVNSSKFPSFFKCANITPILKNESRNHKTSYRPVSILPIVSNIF